MAHMALSIQRIKNSRLSTLPLIESSPEPSVVELLGLFLCESIYVIRYLLPPSTPKWHLYSSEQAVLFIFDFSSLTVELQSSSSLTMT
jgi:hypothetical protein